MNNELPLLNRRQRLRLTLRFRLRTGQTSGEKPRQLYIRLTVDGEKCSDYASGVYIIPAKWNTTTQRATGYSKLAQEANSELESIEAEHKSLLAELMRLYQCGVITQQPVAKTIKRYWLNKATLVPTLMDAYTAYLSYLRSLDGTPDAREPKTLSKWENGKTHLEAYLKESESTRLTVDMVTPIWAKGFYHYLINRPLGLATASRYVGYLRASINYLVETRQISQNPIGGYFPNKGKDKPVYFMEGEHLDRLWSLDSSTGSTHRLVRDWLLLMSYTGLDQPDLERYLANRSEYEELTEDGVLIVINRGKTDLIACIPLVPEVNQVLSAYPNGIPTLTNQSINRWSLVIEEQIGFNERLTTKICRKTAGALFLTRGYTLTEVSKILGHSSIQTTLRNYVHVTSAMVKAGMKRVQSATPNPHHSFTHISKT